MSEIEIRRADDDDREGLCELIERFYRIDNHEYDAARVAAGLAPLLRDDQHGQVWVATTGASLIGYVVVTWSWSLESGGRDCILDELYVDRRGDGLGAALLRHAMDEARWAGTAAMFLETEAPNEAARRFYRRHGFSADDSTWMSRALN
jgi:GNAT superfamily N-acetyltransferase